MSRDNVDESERARDAARVARVRAGDADVFDQLFCEYYPMLVRFAVTMGYSRDVAEDAASDVFTAVWRNREQWTIGRAALRSYFFAAVRNRIFNAARHAKVEAAHAVTLDPDAELVMPQGSGAIEAEETRRVLRVAIRALSERRRAALYLRFVEALTYREIGEVLQITTRSVEELVERALVTLRRALGQAP